MKRTETGEMALADVVAGRATCAQAMERLDEADRIDEARSARRSAYGWLAVAAVGLLLMACIRCVGS